MMRSRTSVIFVVGAALLAATTSALAAEASAPRSGRMKMDQPMPTGMAKPGMKKGDVKKSAEKKEQEMKPMIDQESIGKGGK